MQYPKFKDMERAYGFDEVALVPGDVTVNPDQTDIRFVIGPHELQFPILASAMDAVVSPSSAIEFGKLGGLAVLNLEGLQTRYDDPDAILQQLAESSQRDVTALLQKLYTAPIREDLIAERISTIKKAGVICSVSVTPANTKHLAPVAKEAGVDILVVQSTVTTASHTSKSTKGLILSELCEEIKLPVIVGNCCSYNAALELMRTGVDAILVGVGPGAACTSREVLGIGVPQVSATSECAAARETHFKETGRYVSLITDGGIRLGSDLCKSFASGADAVMIGSPLAQAKGAPGRGFHWGMSHPHPALPRGTRVKVGSTATLEQIIFGPSSVTDGTQNLVGALRTSMGLCGAKTIREMQHTRMIVAPAIKTEGKYLQMTQGA
ncbi:MAG: GuaB3 family IMP dehydrogenase-related protein [Chloroflexi bacterium]|nr:GuaB3 family IMP dehydrogenase-related protein [Chloroflexota bacterium]